jgi:hypothetical protein
MPKLSFAQEMYEMERVVAAARSNVCILPDPDLALTLADQLAAIIAEAKELKSRQQTLLAAQMVKTEEMAVLIQRGTWVVRRLRAYILLVLGTRHAQLTQFGIRLRRRPRRKAAEPPASIRDDRPEDRRQRAIAEPDGATVAEIGGTVLQLGGEDSGLGADIASLGAAASPEGGAVPPPGGTAAGDRAIVPEDRADANRRGAIVPETRAAAARAD